MSLDTTDFSLESMCLRFAHQIRVCDNVQARAIFFMDVKATKELEHLCGVPT
jgi:hypothetical protein